MKTETEAKEAAPEWVYVTLKDDHKGPRSRVVLGATFKAGDKEKATQRLRLTKEQRAELEASGEYTFRPAAEPVTDGPLSARKRNLGSKKPPEGEPAAPAPTLSPGAIARPEAKETINTPTASPVED